jgi:ribonuclease Z
LQFEVTILGSNGAIPAFNRHPTSQVVSYNGSNYLIDCGEGTQLQMSKYSVKRGKLDHIFISHLHGDHYFGLIGLLTSFNLNYRTTDLHLYGPHGLDEIMNVHFKYAETKLKYAIVYHELKADEPRIIYENRYFSVETIILKHRLPTTGFLFKEKQPLRRIITEKIAEYKIPQTRIFEIKHGEDFVTEQGITIANTELTREPNLPRSYAYCSDTIYLEEIVPQLKGVDLLYHESTFIDEHADRAAETFHSTARQAATIAKKADVQKLLLGHFSARYEDLSIILDESRRVFANSHLAIEGETFPVDIKKI